MINEGDVPVWLPVGGLTRRPEKNIVLPLDCTTAPSVTGPSLRPEKNDLHLCLSTIPGHPAAHHFHWSTATKLVPCKMDEEAEKVEHFLSITESADKTQARILVQN
jgi:hypothetical protein